MQPPTCVHALLGQGAQVVAKHVGAHHAAGRQLGCLAGRSVVHREEAGVNQVQLGLQQQQQQGAAVAVVREPGRQQLLLQLPLLLQNKSLHACSHAWLAGCWLACTSADLRITGTPEVTDSATRMCCAPGANDCSHWR